jgi:hypothetical protein
MSTNVSQRRLVYGALGASLIGAGAAALVLLAVVVATEVPVRAEDANPLVGTWRLVSFDREIVATKEVVHAFGGHATGFAIYTANGRFMSMYIDSTRKPPAQPMATDSEAIDLYRSMSAYAGSYRVEGDTFIWHVDIASNQTDNGLETRRHFKVDGDRLTYSTEPLQNAFLSNQMVSARLVWERLK